MALNRFAFALAICFFLTAFSQFRDPVERLVNSLQMWVEVNPQEKVHLHLDKPYYAQGDTIWFKAYVVLGSRHHLSTKSGALYVDLINESGSIIKSLKLPITAGTTMGAFVLDNDVVTGAHRIRAYTQWMRNAGEAFFFDQTFMVAGLLGEASDNKRTLSSKPGKVLSFKDSLMKSDLQFFPEGGTLVNGITSRVGFKITGMNGLGLAAKGMLLDQDNKTITTFETSYAGMGNFIIRPEIGKAYTVKVAFPDGTEKTTLLPLIAVYNGCTLGVYQPNADSILVRINTASPGQTVAMVAQSGAETIFASQVTLNKTTNSIWLAKKRFPSGIAQFTLFDSQGNPTHERIVFIKTLDQMQVTVNGLKRTYKRREQVSLDLLAKDSRGEPIAGSFSVSVVDESKVPQEEKDEHTIFSNLLLKSDIKGYLEKPNYYFTAENETADVALDNLMLTQGYRRFDWKSIKDYTHVKPTFSAEGLGTSIYGVIKTLGSKLLANAPVTLMSLKAGILHRTTSDSVGRFKFEDLLLSDSLRFTVQAMSPKKSNKVELVLDSIPKISFDKNKNWADVSAVMSFNMADYIANGKRLDSIYEKTGQLDRVQRLRQVNIKARKPQQIYANQGIHRIPEGHADRTIDMSREKPFATFGLMLPSLLPNVQFKVIDGIYYPYTKDGDMKIILDGRPLDGLELAGVFDGTTVDLSDIVKLDVIISNMALKATLNSYGEPTRPVLMIYTKAVKRRAVYMPNMVNISPKGFNKVRSFYSPKYDVNNNVNLPDLRTTIFWNPNLKTYATGRGSFDYYNADGPGTFKIKIEGINSEGEISRTVLSYNVEY